MCMYAVWIQAYKQQQMKLSRIIRGALPFNLPARAGIPPTWDRPDPPATKRTPFQKRLSVDQKHFSFFDAASPTYMLVNSEVAEGDLGEAFPSFVKNLAMLVLTGAAIGLTGLLFGNFAQVWLQYNFNYEVDKLQSEKKIYETKYGLKDLQSNPWKLNVWPQSFPIRNLGVLQMSEFYGARLDSIETTRKINKEVQAYWSKLYSECQQALKKGGSGHH